MTGSVFGAQTGTAIQVNANGPSSLGGGSVEGQGEPSRSGVDIFPNTAVANNSMLVLTDQPPLLAPAVQDYPSLSSASSSYATDSRAPERHTVAPSSLDIAGDAAESTPVPAPNLTYHGRVLLSALVLYVGANAWVSRATMRWLLNLLLSELSAESNNSSSSHSTLSQECADDVIFELLTARMLAGPVLLRMDDHTMV